MKIGPFFEQSEIDSIFFINEVTRYSAEFSEIDEMKKWRKISAKPGCIELCSTRWFMAGWNYKFLHKNNNNKFNKKI